MIILSTTRQKAEALKNHFLPYLSRLQQSKLNDVANCDITSDAYLTVLAINCVLSDVAYLIERKLYLTIGVKVKFQFSEAEAIVLYKFLLAFPVPADQIYLQLLRNEIIAALNQEFQTKLIYKRPAPASITGD